MYQSVQFATSQVGIVLGKVSTPVLTHFVRNFYLPRTGRQKKINDNDFFFDFELTYQRLSERNLF